MISVVKRRTSWGAVIAASALLHAGVAWALLHAHFRGEAEPGQERTISLVFVEEAAPGNAPPRAEAADETPSAERAPETLAAIEQPSQAPEAPPPAMTATAPAAAEPPAPAVVPATRPAQTPARKAATKSAPAAAKTDLPAPSLAALSPALSGEATAAVVTAPSPSVAPVASPPIGITREAMAILAPQPAYPPSARRRGIEGEVVVAIHVDEEGRPASVSVQESSGIPALDEAAVKAGEGWRFSPALKDGQKVAVEIRKPIRFRLTD